MNRVHLFFLFFILSLSYACSGLSHKRLTIIAHRGAPGLVPEHTLAGVALAHSFNPDYIEADVVLTKDQKLIVLHDIHLDTTTNVAKVYPGKARDDGRYYAVDFNLAEIQRLQIKERFKHDSKDKVFPERYPKGITGLRVPSYQQFITMLNHLNEKFDKEIGLYVEIKKPEFHLNEGMDITKKLVEAHAGLLKESSKTIIQCFWPDSLVRLKEEFRVDIPLVQLIAENKWSESSADYEKMISKKGLKKVSSYAQGVGLWLKRASPTIVERIQHHNLFVHAYTHRTNKHIQQIEKLGIDGLFTDQAEFFTQGAKQ